MTSLVTSGWRSPEVTRKKTCPRGEGGRYQDCVPCFPFRPLYNSCTNFIRKCCFLAVLHVLQYKKCLVPCDKCVVCTFGARERVQHMQLTLSTSRFVLEVRSWGDLHDESSKNTISNLFFLYFPLYFLLGGLKTCSWEQFFGCFCDFTPKGCVYAQTFLGG